MKRYKVTFQVNYWDSGYSGCAQRSAAERSGVIYAENTNELQQKALKVFVNDQIEDETGLLDNAIGVTILSYDYEG
jgi:hypothetical protein